MHNEQRHARIARRLVAGFVPVALVVAGACNTSTTLPGTAEGTYAVVGTVKTNTCGSGVGATSPWDFSLELSEDGSTLYMAETDGSNEMSGALSAATATLTSTVTSNVDGTDASAGACNLTQASSFTITLDSATAPTRFSGTVTYTYSAATGVSSTNDCTDQLASSGGKYSTLPCTVTYALSATRQ